MAGNGHSRTNAAIGYNGIFLYCINVLMLVTIASLPFSINFHFKSTNISVIYPAEILIALLCISAALLLILPGFRYLLPDKNFLLHPITLLICTYMGSTLFSTFASTMLMVSLKATIIKFAYILSFYFLTHALLKNDRDKFILWFKTYGLSFSIILLYAFNNHLHLPLNRANAGYVAKPFYIDHTIYGAVLVFLLPLFLTMSLFPSSLNLPSQKFRWTLVLSVMMLLALYFSFCRAAWISFWAGGMVLLLVKSGVRFYGFAGLTIACVLFIGINEKSLMDTFKHNKTDSNVTGAGLYEQLFSLTNITNDLSNTERLNRWKCAVRMWKDKPFTGFGTGTYQFKYLSFQKKNEMTYISVKDPFKITEGNGGSAHSEYLLALSESGILAFLSFAGLAVCAMYCSIRLYFKQQDHKIKAFGLILLVGLVSYFIHGMFNNFLDNCKIAFLFWVSLSFLSTLDTYVQKKFIGEEI
jgi:putative inorganic carbon (HCO3(-)) transporter